MQSDTYHFGALEGEGSNVDVLPEVVAADELDARRAKLIQGDRDLELQHFHRILHPAVMLPKLEDEELLVLRAPVSADALKDPGAVVQGVGHQAQASLPVALECPVQVDPVLLLLFPPGLSRARDALGFDRHRLDYMPGSSHRHRAFWT